MNRSQLLRLQVFAEAVARSAASLISDEASYEWEENRTAASWRTADERVLASARVSQLALVVEDDQKFLAWMREQYPTEIVSVLVPINPKWVIKKRQEWAKAIAAGEIDAPPGTRLHEGGVYLGTSVGFSTTRANTTFRMNLERTVRRQLEIGEVPQLDRSWEVAEALTAGVDDPVKGS